MILYIVLRIIPIFNTFRMSMYNWDLISINKEFIGTNNFKELLSDSNFLVSMKNTLIYSFCVVFLTITISLVLALVLQGKFKGKGFFETVYFLPYVVAVVSASLAWKFIYDPTNGVLNAIIGIFGIHKQAWLVNEETALFSIVVMAVWQKVGYNIVIFSVGLGEIPKDYYEAARVDGANSIQIARRITLPLLLPVTSYLLIMNTIEAFNTFTEVYVMTSGTQSAPASAVKVLVMDIYQNAFRFFRMGYASAESVCLFLVVLLFSMLQLFLVRNKEAK